MIDSNLNNQKPKIEPVPLFFSALSSRFEGKEIKIKWNVCIYEICIKFANKMSQTMTSTALAYASIHGPWVALNARLRSFCLVTNSPKIEMQSRSIRTWEIAIAILLNGQVQKILHSFFFCSVPFKTDQNKQLTFVFFFFLLL